MKIRSSERWQQIELLFAGALALSPEARTEYLDRSCGHDAELRLEVGRLLAASWWSPSLKPGARQSSDRLSR